MELKKNPDKEINSFRGLFINVGAVVTLLVTIMLFQWNFSDAKMDEDLVKGIDDDDMEETIITEIQPPPPPPKIKIPTIEIVEDDEDIEEEEIPDNETDDEEEMPDVPDDVPDEEEDKIFLVVEQEAVPRGGMAAFRTHINKYLVSNYPERAKKAGISGTVYINFYIDKDGVPKGFKILKGIGGGCDEAAIEAIKSYGAWSPPEQRGKPVKQGFNFPVKFKIG